MARRIKEFFVVGCACLLCSCEDQPVVMECCIQGYSLEIVNATTDPIRVQVVMAEGYLDDRGTVELDAHGRMTLQVTRFVLGGRNDSSEDGVYVRELEAVYFSAEGAQLAYSGYVYLGFGCGVGLGECEDHVDDTLVYHRLSNGKLERLFVESSDRPFYLERDEQNRDLGRLMITFVPNPALAARSDRLQGAGLH